MLFGKNGNRNLKDAAFFGRVLSAGILIAGYAFAGVFLARWLEGRGYAAWLVGATPLAVTAFGLWQGWLFLREAWKKNRSDDKNK